MASLRIACTASQAIPLVIFCILTTVASAPVNITLSSNSTVSFLHKYGYLENVSSIAPSFTDSQVVKALKEFQRYFQLNETGVVDNATSTLMQKPRCGVPDKNRASFKLSFTKSGRKKRSIAINRRKSGMRANTVNGDLVFYFFINPIDPKLPYGYDTVYNAFEYAFNMWAAVTNLVFRRGDTKNYTDILLGFYGGDHGDSAPFDGTGRVLAHATTGFPWLAHFDVGEIWKLKESQKYKNYFIHPTLSRHEVDMVQTAIHEIGHLFGIDHVTHVPSVMFPYNPTNLIPDTDYFLYEYDIQTIQASYGTCSPQRFDAIFSAKNRGLRTYIIVGPYVYKMNSSTVVQSWPRISKEEFNVEYINEGVQNGDGYLYLFGKNDYRVNLHTIISVPAGPDRVWPGLNTSRNVDAAVVFPDGFTYLFQQDMVYKWVPIDAQLMYLPVGKVAPGYPKKIKDVFKGVPDNLDTAFKSPIDGKVYIFKGKHFYIWDDTKKMAEGIYDLDQWHNVCNVYKCRTKNGPCLHW